MRKWKTRLLSITLALVTALTTVQIPTLVDSDNNVLPEILDSYVIDANAALPATEGSLIGGAEVTDIALGTGHGQWNVEPAFLTYVTWARIPVSQLNGSTPGEYITNHLQENMLTDPFVYNTTLAWGVSGKTNAYGLILQTNPVFSNMIYNNIGGNGRFNSYIDKDYSKDIRCGCSTPGCSICKETRQLLASYHDGIGNNGTAQQANMVSNIHGVMCHIYTLLYKYGGMPQTYYEEAKNYTMKGVGDYAYAIVTTKLVFPYDMRAITGAPGGTDVVCSCDPVAHDSTLDKIHTTWFEGLAQMQIGTSYLLTRESNADTYIDGIQCSMFSKTWSDVLSQAIHKKYDSTYPASANSLIAHLNDDTNGAVGDLPFLATPMYFYRVFGQNLSQDYDGIGSLTEGVIAGDPSSAKKVFYKLYSLLAPVRSLAFLPSLKTYDKLRPLEYRVGETPLDADGNPIKDMNGNPIVIPPYNHYVMYDDNGNVIMEGGKPKEYTTSQIVYNSNGTKIGTVNAVGKITTSHGYNGNFSGGSYTSPDALTVFNNLNRWPVVEYNGNEVVAKVEVVEKGQPGVNNAGVVLSGNTTDPALSGQYMGFAAVGMNYARNMRDYFCINPQKREADGTNMEDTAFANVILTEDNRYIFGYSYLTVAGVGLRFDVKGEIQDQVINLIQGQTGKATPMYSIRLHYEDVKDLNILSPSVQYTIRCYIDSAAGRSIQNLENERNVSIPGFTSGSVIWTGDGSSLRAAFESNSIIKVFTANPVDVIHGNTLSWPCGFRLTLEGTDGSVIDLTPQNINNGNTYNGFKSGQVNNYAYGTNYASAYGGDIERVPWNQQSGSTPRAYSEIVANEVGNQDWNVLQGIPSTENLSISAGGDAFLVGYSGWTYRIGSAQTSGWSNEGAGDPMDSPGTTRTITIKTTIKDIWSGNNGNAPCTLSCGGTHSYSLSNSVGNSGSAGTGSSANGQTNSGVCSVCGAAWSQSTSGGADETCNCNDPTCDGKCVPATDATWSEGHSCSWTLTFNCETGAFSGDDGGSTSVINSNNQYYVPTGKIKCGTQIYDADLSGLCTSLIDEGYTIGKGCTCSNSANHQHEYDSTYTYYVKQYIDTWTYRQICNVKLYGLSRSYIKSIDGSILTNGTGESAPAVGLKACLWRACTTDVTDGYTNGNGRLWFQQFNSPYYTNGSGWTSTTATGSSSSKVYDYWLGDCTVHITAYADQKVAQSTARSDTSVASWNASIRSNAGSADGHKTGSPTSSNTTWQTSKYATGDWLSSDEILAQHQQMVNSWQNANNIAYTIVSVSDGLSLATTDNFSQDITGAMYNITHSGGSVYLFNYPFLSNGETHYRNWNAPQGNDLNEDGRGGLIKLADPTLQIGYTGVANQLTPSSNGRNFTNTYAYGLAKSGVTPNNFGAEGGTAVSGSACYTTAISPGEKNNSGYTLWELVKDGNGTQSDEEFRGYWDKHTYDNIGSYKYVWKMNGTKVNNTDYTTSNSGTGNLNSYGSALVISNLDIIDTAPNGKYIPCQVNNTYVKLADITNDTSAQLVLNNRVTEYETEFKSGYGTINEVIIHDPITVQYCKVISNGAGAYASGITDESGEDWRVTSDGVAEYDKPDYYVLGNTIHIAYSDIGDFYSPLGTTMDNSTASRAVAGTGDTGYGCDWLTGTMNQRTGYVNHMNCSRWVQERYVKFPCSVSYTSRDGSTKIAAAETYIALSDVKATSQNGTKGTVNIATINGNSTIPSNKESIAGLFHHVGVKSDGTDGLIKFEDSEDPYVYGLDFEFTCLTSALEASQVYVEFITTAINDKPEFVNNDPTEHTNNVHILYNNGKDFASSSSVRKSVTVDLVGRIGNLTINDTGDFRFSNFFKKQTSGYLIPGVVPNTDYKTPNRVMATKLDILGNIAGYNATGKSLSDDITYRLPGLNVLTSHATLSMTNYSNTLGKAGPFVELPLSAAVNNIREFTNEQLRPGYEILMDIETIGNYYGINKDDMGNAIFGPDSITEMNGSPDLRKYGVRIIPHYYLYVPGASAATSKYVDIDIYSGVEGKRTLLWSPSSLETTNSNAALYVDLTQESFRRNVSDTEQKATDIITSEIGHPSFAVDGSTSSDFIGTSSLIVLDARNRTFIGSNVYYGCYTLGTNKFLNPAIPTMTGWSQTGTNELDWNETNSNPETLTDDHDFLTRSQRWHFTLGLPSSTYITEDKATMTNQNDIESSHEKLKNQYPNGVIVCFLEIYASDPVWTLEYDNEMSQGLTGNTSAKVKISEGTDLDSPSDDIYLYYPNTPGVQVNSSRPIDSKWALSLVMDAWNTSAKDLDTYGTH